MRKIFAVSLSVLFVAGTPAAGSDFPPDYCPYDLTGSGLTAEEIEEICEEWRRENTPPPRGTPCGPKPCGQPV